MEITTKNPSDYLQQVKKIIGITLRKYSLSHRVDREDLEQECYMIYLVDFARFSRKNKTHYSTKFLGLMMDRKISTILAEKFPLTNCDSL